MDRREMDMYNVGYDQPTIPGFGIQAGNPQPGNQTFIVSQNTERYHSETAFYVACAILWCCNPLFGFVAFILAVIASTRAGDGDIKGARLIGRISIWVSVAGVIVTVIMIVVWIILFFVVLEDEAEELFDNWGSGSD